jgi:hypothetical protein
MSYGHEEGHCLQKLLQVGPALSSSQIIGVGRVLVSVQLREQAPLAILLGREPDVCILSAVDVRPGSWTPDHVLCHTDLLCQRPSRRFGVLIAFVHPPCFLDGRGLLFADHKPQGLEPPPPQFRPIHVLKLGSSCIQYIRLHEPASIPSWSANPTPEDDLHTATESHLTVCLPLKPRYKAWMAQTAAANCRRASASARCLPRKPRTSLWIRVAIASVPGPPKLHSHRRTLYPLQHLTRGDQGDLSSLD